jgi:hypothetical protein
MEIHIHDSEKIFTECSSSLLLPLSIVSYLGFCTVYNVFCFPKGKWQGCEADHLPPFSTEVMMRCGFVHYISETCRSGECVQCN